MQERLHEAKVSGKTPIAHYAFDSVNVVLIEPFGVQTGGSVGLESRGTVTEETYDRSGALLDRRTSPFALTFAMRQPTGDRWLIVAVLPPTPGT
jgi:hypothetical protein